MKKKKKWYSGNPKPTKPTKPTHLVVGEVRSQGPHVSPGGAADLHQQHGAKRGREKQPRAEHLLSNS
ncbi:hypothetical protein EYF80_021914 [Liparis tanakae]|uniref:Uncharacterized protein n=1 Tax=Liparis tanakae TaxID=230148 RepID=A0A4Z2HRK1_9TELE|nr:hypothetical protein EYF80_021914 [Liparis tanakae]